MGNIEDKQTDMDLVRRLKKYRAPLPEIKLKDSLNRLKKTGVIDGLAGAVNVGLVLDSFNNEVTRKKDHDFANETNARNKYYAPLWKMAVEEYLSSSRFSKITTPNIGGTDVKNRNNPFKV